MVSVACPSVNSAPLHFYLLNRSYTVGDLSVHHNVGFRMLRTEFSLRRQHFDDHWVCSGEPQDPSVEEDVAAAHSSTQQPVSRQSP